MTKLFIASPAYSGKVNVQFAISLAETYGELLKLGIKPKIEIHCSGSLLCAERNRLVKAFLQSDCTHFLTIDSDIGWPAACIPALILKDVDFVAGCYPARKSEAQQENVFLFRPSCNDDGSVIKDQEKALLKMEYIPAGFMMIKRHVFEKIIQDNPEIYFRPKHQENPEDGWCFFNTEVYEGEFWGEDYSFCRLVRKSGFNIWVDPCIEFDHDGTRGLMMNVLTDDKEKAMK